MKPVSRSYSARNGSQLCLVIFVLSKNGDFAVTKENSSSVSIGASTLHRQHQSIFIGSILLGSLTDDFVFAFFAAGGEKHLADHAVFAVLTLDAELHVLADS